MQLTPVAGRQPAGVVLKPVKPIANRASYGLLRCSNHPSPAPLPAHSNVRMMGSRSCSGARARARAKARDDEAESSDEPQAPAKEGEEAAAAGRNQGAQRSMAYQIFESVYLCAYVLSYRIGEAVVLNAEDALKRFRGYVRDKFNQKR